MITPNEINKLLNYPAKHHQIFGFNFALQKSWSINGFQMGEGKTLIAIMISLYTKSKTLIVSPAFLKINWQREIQKFSKKKLNIKVLTSKELNIFKPTDEDVIILNYEIAYKAVEVFKWAEFIALDESHMIGNPSAKRTKAIFNFCIKYLPERLLLMSGSPIRGKVASWYVPIKLTGANPKGTSGLQFEKRYIAFQDKFSRSRMVHVGSRLFKTYYGLQNEDELRLLLKDKFLRKCPDFELELPKITFQPLTVDYEVDDVELRELYEEYEKTKKMSEHLSSAKKSNALSKVPFTYKFVKNIVDAGEHPVAVYSDHPAVLEELQKLLKKAKISSTVIVGGTPMDTRQEYVDAFQNKETDVFLATIGSANTGITITVANKFIFNDKNWVSTENEQAYKRIHRISQERDCIIYSIYSGKVDKMICKNNEAKDYIVRETVDFKLTETRRRQSWESL